MPLVYNFETIFDRFSNYLVAGLRCQHATKHLP